jgi:acetoin utilization protein AcuB
MEIKDIMTPDVIKVGIYDPLKTIRELFAKYKFHHLLVMENQKLVGVISDRDLLKALSPFLGTISELTRDLVTLNKKAHHIMSRKAVTIDCDASIETAANLLLNEKVSCLPVVSPDGCVEGIITWKDILQFYIVLK